MSDRYEPDPFDEFLREADVLIDIIEKRRTGDLVEQLCILAAQLACMPKEAREICSLDSYYDAVIAYAFEALDDEEVA